MERTSTPTRTKIQFSYSSRLARAADENGMRAADILKHPSIMHKYGIPPGITDLEVRQAERELDTHVERLREWIRERT